MDWSVKSIWEKRTNIKNRPSVKNKTILVVEHIMEKDGVPAGVALEKLIESSPVYSEVVEELKNSTYKDL
jgi:hypothetical protein